MSENTYAPKVSIIVPIYNAAQYLEKCIGSLLNQSYKNYEIILVDDGSTDRSGDVCDEYARIDERIKVFHTPNKGVSSARNVGLDAAQGEWIAFVDADDTLPLNALETLLSYSSNSLDIVVAGYNTVKDGEVINKLPKISKRVSNLELAKELYSPTDKKYLGITWAKLYNRSIINTYKIRFDESIKYNEDRLFVLEFLSKSQGGTYTTLPVYNYILREDSAMASINGPKFHLFETDLDAFIKMNTIAKQFNNSRLKKLIYRGTIFSYEWNRRLNKEFGSNNNETNKRLKQKLYSVVPYRYILFWNLDENIRKIVRRYPKMKKYIKRLYPNNS